MFGNVLCVKRLKLSSIFIRMYMCRTKTPLKLMKKDAKRGSAQTRENVNSENEDVASENGLFDEPVMKLVM